MITNWQEHHQTLVTLNNSSELWKYSLVKNFVNYNLPESSDPIEFIPLKHEQLPTFMQGEMIYFNGHKWVSNSSSLVFENNLSSSLEHKFQQPLSQQQLIDKDSVYSWYKAQTKSQLLKINQPLNLVIFIPHSDKQILLPELYIQCEQDDKIVTIYEVHSDYKGNNSVTDNSADKQSPSNVATLYSIKLLVTKSSVHYHRLSLREKIASVSWLQVLNQSEFTSYIWKHKELHQKEFISIDNQNTTALCSLKLLANIDGNSHLDLTTQINHTKKETTSSQIFKCILADSAKAALTGKITIDKNCPQSKAHFRSKHTLLSSRAHIHSQPQLEILTDDVECAHGSSTGSLQEEELFYLISRGIHPIAAKQLLLRAFMMDDITTLQSSEEQHFFKDLIL